MLDGVAGALMCLVVENGAKGVAGGDFSFLPDAESLPVKDRAIGDRNT